MQPRQIINPEICKENCCKSDYGEIGNALSMPAPHHAGMQQGRVDKPGNQRPGLFGIPAPVTAPGGIGPDRSGYDSDSKKQKPEHDQLMVEVIQNSGFGKMY